MIVKNKSLDYENENRPRFRKKALWRNCWGITGNGLEIAGFCWSGLDCEKGLPEGFPRFIIPYTLYFYRVLNLKEESEKTIKPGDTKEFTYNWEPKLSGKHLLTIDIYADDGLVKHIERIVDVNTDIIIEDKLAKVNLT